MVDFQGYRLLDVVFFASWLAYGRGRGASEGATKTALDQHNVSP